MLVDKDSRKIHPQGGVVHKTLMQLFCARYQLKGAVHGVAVRQQHIDTAMAEHFHQLLEAWHLLLKRDASGLEPDGAVTAQYAADTQLLVPDGAVERLGSRAYQYHFSISSGAESTA